MRTGRKHIPSYRIVVNEAKTKRDGEYVELLGHYNPSTTPKTLEIDVEKYTSWIKKGAQPTETVAALFKRYEKSS